MSDNNRNVENRYCPRQELGRKETETKNLDGGRYFGGSEKHFPRGSECCTISP
jgi:hypothetical protein